MSIYNERVIKATYETHNSTPTEQKIVKQLVADYPDIQVGVVTLITLDALTMYKNMLKEDGDKKTEEKLWT